MSRRRLVVALGIVLSLMMMVPTLHAQKKTPPPSSGKQVSITGKVIDKGNNEPIIGATIRVKGPEVNGTTTNIKGEFTLNNLTSKSVIQISYIGYKPREIVVGKQRKMTIYLEESAQALDQVVVMGYQKLKKNSFTGTATIVTKKDLEQVNAKDAIKALEVFDPSFRILDNLGFGADPNQVHEINIRGASSISQNRGLDVEQERLTQRTNLRDNPNMPIFMLDGFEVDVQKIYDMDMNRIQSITILKDAAATALYGSRAANGVIIITSIPPKAGEIRVDYNATLELTFPDLYDYNLANASEKLELEKAAGLYTGDTPFLTKVKELEYNNKLNEVRRGVYTDWLSRPLRNAYNLRNYVSLSGGVNEVRYMLDFNYDKNAGVMKGSYRNRFGGGMMIDYRLRSWLQIQNKVSFNKTSYEDSPFGYFNDYSTYQPYDAIVGPDGHYLQTLPMSRIVNPLWLESNLLSYRGRGGIQDFTDNLSVNIHFNSNLYLRGTFSVSKVMTSSDSFTDPADPKYVTVATNRRGELSVSNDERVKWNANALLHYNKRLNKHFLNLTGGMDMQETIDSRLRYTMNGFAIGSLNRPIYAASQPRKSDAITNKARLVGFLGALNYTYDEIYLLDASFRLDGSSQFGTARRFAPFASVGLGLNIHNYDFLKDNYYVNTLRLKGTYGSTGKVNFSRFDVVTSYITDATSWYKTGPAVSLATMGNPRLTWEVTNTLDLGITTELFKNRVYLEANYYRKMTDGLIDKVAIRPSSGFTTLNGNTGSILNEGVEIKANVTAFRNKDWSVVLNANMASNTNRITKLDKGMEEYNQKIRDNYDAERGAAEYAELQNKPLIMYYVGASTSAIYAMPSLGIDPASGKEIFVKKDGTITKEWNAADMVVCGDNNPKIQGAFGINVAWKGIYASASFLYAMGGQIYNQTLLQKVENADIQNSNVDKRIITDRWRKVGDLVPFYDLRETVSTKPTSRFVQDDNHVYFNSLSVGYDFGKKVTSFLRLSALSLSFNASDLARWSTVKVERGLSYPYAHTYSMSIRASY